MDRLDTIHATTVAISLGHDAASLAADLARAHDDETGIWADNARRTLASVTDKVAEIEAALAALPSSEAKARARAAA